MIFVGTERAEGTVRSSGYFNVKGGTYLMLELKDNYSQTASSQTIIQTLNKP